MCIHVATVQIRERSSISPEALLAASVLRLEGSREGDRSERSSIGVGVKITCLGLCV